MAESKTIVITGSEGKIGKALKTYFQKKKFRIIGLDIKKGINSIYCDVTNENDVKKNWEIF